ncbi:hypothetical protein NQ315_011107 [Exocentrus adspersus]|uniref:Uncharacterized protein n=1 Tax=Exocentrus adspersus TaxID=1586481 RepID=A0AAV8VYY7_9CUCU|nr:hypothetical protein NQ315_011107 [Exocentrus adspersus]
MSSWFSLCFVLKRNPLDVASFVGRANRDGANDDVTGEQIAQEPIREREIQKFTFPHSSIPETVYHSINQSVLLKFWNEIHMSLDGQ